MLHSMIQRIMVNAIDRYAKENSVQPADSQIIVLAADSQATPTYKRLIRGQSAISVTFKQILNVKVDLLNREAIAAPFMQRTLQNLAKELECDVQDVRVYIYKSSQNGVVLHVYHKTRPVRQMELSEVFTDSF